MKSIGILLVVIGIAVAGPKVKKNEYLNCVLLDSIGVVPPYSGYEKSWVTLFANNVGHKDTIFILYLSKKDIVSIDTNSGSFYRIYYHRGVVDGFVGGIISRFPNRKILDSLKKEVSCK